MSGFLPETMILAPFLRLCAAACAVLALGGPAAADDDPPPAAAAPLLRDHPLVGTVWQPGESRAATPAEVVRAAEAADFVLLGETHDNPDAHAAQAWLLRRMVAAGRRPAVAWEMIATDRAPDLQAALSTRPDDAAGLGQALGWADSGWPDWAMYRPIAAAAMTARLVMEPAGLPRDTVRAVLHGDAPAAMAADLALPLDGATEAAMEAEIADAHCGMMPASALPGMVRVQRARDLVMARALMTGSQAAGAAGRGGAVLIAGSGHARTDHGVPWWLARLAPGRRVLAVAFVEVEAGTTDPAAYADTFGADRLPFDYVWFTPRAERKDPCEGLARHMERKKG